MRKIKHKKKMGKIPDLRFPEFDGEWDDCNLKEKIRFLAGYAFKSEFMSSEPDVFQLIKMSNVYKNEFRLDRNPSFWKTIDKNQRKFLLKKGDTVLTLTGIVNKRDYGYSVSIPRDNKFLINQRLVCLSGVGGKSDNEFIRQLVLTDRFYYHFFSNSKGGTGNQSNVSIEDLKNIKLNFSPLPEQKKIASFLSEVDKKIQQLTRKKELLAQYKKGVMQKIFSQEIRFKDENRNDYPDWEEKRLGDVCNGIKSGKSKPIENEKYPLYGSTGLIGFCENFSHKGKYILVARVGANAGTVNYINDCFGVTDNTLIIDTYSDIEIKFLYYLLIYICLKRLIFGSGQPLITGAQLKSLKIQVPRVDEQRKIGSYLTIIDKKIGNIQTQIEKNKEFKKGLLQQMFV